MSSMSWRPKRYNLQYYPQETISINFSTFITLLFDYHSRLNLIWHICSSIIGTSELIKYSTSIVISYKQVDVGSEIYV